MGESCEPPKNMSLTKKKLIWSSTMTCTLSQWNSLGYEYSLHPWETIVQANPDAQEFTLPSLKLHCKTDCWWPLWSLQVGSVWLFVMIWWEGRCEPMALCSPWRQLSRKWPTILSCSINTLLSIIRSEVDVRWWLHNIQFHILFLNKSNTPWIHALTSTKHSGMGW